MALFSDGPPCSIEDLCAHDSQLLNVSNAEGIDVTRKLALAHEEMAVDIGGLLTGMSYASSALWISPEPDLHTVAVTEPLRLWHAFRSLEAVYADAYNCQLNDRYAGRRDEFHRQARGAYDKLIQRGLGIVQLPVERAATPVVTTALGALADGTYYVTTAWVNRMGEEGGSAEPAVVNTSSSTILIDPGETPDNAIGWNVYVGPDAEGMILQSAAPIPAGQRWLQPNSLLTSGERPGKGQYPNYLQPVPRLIPRG